MQKEFNRLVKGGVTISQDKRLARLRFETTADFICLLRSLMLLAAQRTQKLLEEAKAEAASKLKSARKLNSVRDKVG